MKNVTILNKNIINKFKQMDIKTFNDINNFKQNEIHNLNPKKDTNNIKNAINDKFNKLDLNKEVSKTINNRKRNFLEYTYLMQIYLNQINLIYQAQRRILMKNLKKYLNINQSFLLHNSMNRIFKR